MKRSILPWLAAIFTVIIWGETFVSTKILLNNGLEPPDIFFFRFILAYACIWIISPKKLMADSWKDELIFVFLGISGGSLYFLAENTALEYSTASNVAILVGSAPLLTALMVGIFYKEERMKLKQLAGSLIAFVGMALVILNGQLVLHINPLGDTLAVCAAAVWGLYSLVIRKVSGRYKVRFITRKVFFYGLVTMLIYFAAVRPLQFDSAVWSKPAVWGNVLYLGLVASLGCFIAWNWVLKELGTVRPTNLIYGQSFCTMLIAAIFLGEKITLMAIGGTVLLVLGMVMAVKND